MDFRFRDSLCMLATARQATKALGRDFLPPGAGPARGRDLQPRREDFPPPGGWKSHHRGWQIPPPSRAPPPGPGSLPLRPCEIPFWSSSSVVRSVVTSDIWKRVLLPGHIESGRARSGPSRTSARWFGGTFAGTPYPKGSIHIYIYIHICTIFFLYTYIFLNIYI